MDVERRVRSKDKLVHATKKTPYIGLIALCGTIFESVESPGIPVTCFDCIARMQP